MLLASKVLNWVAIALLVAGYAPTLLVDSWLALLPFAMALIAFRKDGTDIEKWGALAANAIAVFFYAWLVAGDVVGDDPSPLWMVALVVAYNIVPSAVNVVTLFHVFVWAPDEPERSRTQPPAGW